MVLLDFLAPGSCAFCGVFLTGDERGLCVNCFEDLPWREPPAFPSPGIFECSMAMMDYEFPVDVAIKALKFRRRLYYAPALAEVLCTARRSLPDDIDSVLPVPLHWRRKTLRGFNQATELAAPVARSFGIELLHGVKRCKATPSQSGLGATERRKNLRRAFSLRHRVSSNHVLIIDDVITTGATLTELGKLLLRNGVQKVSTLTVASAR